MNKVFFMVGVLAAVMLLSTPVGAFAKPDMTVSPAITEWAAKPGGTETKTVKVINPKDSPIPLRVIAEAMIVQEEIASEERARFDASQWFSISDPYFILKAKETREVKITLKVPKDAEPGGHYATIYFQQFVPVTGAQQTIVAGQVGVLAFITAKGVVKQQLISPSGVEVNYKADGTVDFSAALHNTGNVHLLPTGRFVVKDWRGNVLATLPLSQGIVLPYTERTYTSTWKKPPWMGYVSVTAEIGYGDKKEKLIVSGHGFWIARGEWIIPVIIACTMLWWFGFRIRRRWVRMVKTLFTT